MNPELQFEHATVMTWRAGKYQIRQLYDNREFYAACYGGEMFGSSVYHGFDEAARACTEQYKTHQVSTKAETDSSFEAIRRQLFHACGIMMELGPRQHDVCLMMGGRFDELKESMVQNNDQWFYCNIPVEIFDDSWKMALRNHHLWTTENKKVLTVC